MSNINYRLWNRVPSYLHGVMDYYPDVFLYEFNQIQYTRLWRNLTTAPYIYTNGYELKPVGWWTYIFQSFKGWLGFENNCQPEKVAYNLNKLAYYGYTKRFPLPDFSNLSHLPISAEIYALATQNYQEQTTARLQNELIKAFFKVEQQLSLDYSTLNPNHRFGESWLKVGAMDLVPMLNPQDDNLILELVQAVDKTGSPAGDFLKDSKYAQIAAQYYYDKASKIAPPSLLARLLWHDPRPAYLTKALTYNPKLTQEDPPQFIQHYIERKEYKHAFTLLSTLSNVQLALKFLLLIPSEIRDSLITKDTALAAQLAKHYLEKKQYTAAQQLYSNIETLSPVAAFAIAMKNKNYDQAYALFKKHEQNPAFPAEECQSLATVFAHVAKTELEKGASFRANKTWDKAEPHYLRSLQQKKAIQHLRPSAENLEQLHLHQRLYAELLVDADYDSHKPEKSNIANIEQALTLLRAYNPTNKTEQQQQKTILAKALMRRVDTLREKIAFDFHPSDHSSIKKHQAQHQTEIDALIKTLDELIRLLDGTKNKHLRTLLGKAYYLHADVHDFFYINNPNINQNYRKAMDAVPNNPFYVLRASELFPEEQDELRNTGVFYLKNMGFTTFDYVHWSNEAWVKADKIIFNIKGIHTTEAIQEEISSWRFGF